MRQYIMCLRVLKSAMEVLQFGDVSGGECLLYLILDSLLNVEPILPLLEGFDVRPTKLPDCTAVEPIAMTGGGPVSVGTSYVVFIVMRAYWAFENMLPMCLY